MPDWLDASQGHPAAPWLQEDPPWYAEAEGIAIQLERVLQRELTEDEWGACQELAAQGWTESTVTLRAVNEIWANDGLDRALIGALRQQSRDGRERPAPYDDCPIAAALREVS